MNINEACYVTAKPTTLHDITLHRTSKFLAELKGDVSIYDFRLLIPDLEIHKIFQAIVVTALFTKKKNDAHIAASSLVIESLDSGG
ncbi:predicted protein [Botrytis cinerea T4]|uniref:Uncharacterized protein n=1 Tax=Botryotinia fuckeliana (strain T4) TaxID=999810 RepID=G2XZS8_BOTF4|nr:predicted protein [Botrytis cinerea T4]